MIKRWRQAKHLKDMFWKRWFKVYILTLQSRDKWKKTFQNLQVGDVILVSDKTSTGKWPLGVIEGVICSNDGLVRTVEVRTKYGTLTRDIRKLCLLEVLEDRSEIGQSDDFPT
ncbi:unnamed protein product [Trichobilharzia szidati]|nr:unnamed protein product [Trichobilharzia szidati]